MPTVYRRQVDSDEVTARLKALIELQASHHDLLGKMARQIDVALRMLERISQPTNEGLDRAHLQAGLRASLERSGATLLKLNKAGGPELAIAHEASPGELPEYRPQGKARACCRDETRKAELEESGSAESLIGAAHPARVFGARHAHLEFSGEVEEQPAEGGERRVPRGPFRGFITPSAAVGDPVIPAACTAIGKVGVPGANADPDLSWAQSGNLVLNTGLQGASYSADRGSSFTSLNPTAIFHDGPDSGFRRGQIVTYVPRIDRFIWLTAFVAGKNGKSFLRIAAASPREVVASQCTGWTYWDLTASQFGFGNDLDRPDVVAGNDFLYVSADQRGTGLLVIRIRLDEIQAGGVIGFRFTSPADSVSAYGSRLSHNTADEVYWAGNKGNSTLQVFSWHKDSTSYAWRDVGVNNWANDAIASDASDEMPRSSVWTRSAGLR